MGVRITFVRVRSYLQSEQIVDSADDDVDCGCAACLCAQIILEIWRGLKTVCLSVSFRAHHIKTVNKTTIKLSLEHDSRNFVS